VKEPAVTLVVKLKQEEVADVKSAFLYFKMKNYILIGSILLLLILVSGCIDGAKEKETIEEEQIVTERNYDDFAKCLTEKGAKMFGTEWCAHCKDQKKLFGDSFQYIDYIDCDKNEKECDTAGIKGYPTWIIDGEKYEGEQKLSRLASLTGCELCDDEACIVSL